MLVEHFLETRRAVPDEIRDLLLGIGQLVAQHAEGHRRRLVEHVLDQPEELAETVLFLREQPQVRLDEALGVARLVRNVEPGIGEGRRVERVDTNEVHQILDAEVRKQVQHERHLGQHVDRRIEGVAAAAERVRVAARRSGRLGDQDLPAGAREQRGGGQPAQSRADDDNVIAF